MRKAMIIAFALVFFVGLSILMYPTISNYINSHRQAQSIEEYYVVVESLSDREFIELLEAALEYNEGLRRRPNRFIMSEEEMEEYRRLLNPTGGRGAIGTLRIESLDIHLPIYHGTAEGVLQVGIGHMEGSSMPVGGPGTHTALTGHRGVPSSLLLTNLDRMEVGDTFKIGVLGETLTYMVDQIVIVLPHETEGLAIDANADFCTIITCTPYGINTHRLLVRGRRIDNGITDETFVPPMPVSMPSGARMHTEPIAALVLLLPTATVATVILYIRLRRIYGRGKVL